MSHESRVWKFLEPLKKVSFRFVRSMDVLFRGLTRGAGVDQLPP